MNQWATNIRKFYIFRIFTVFSFTNPILMYYMIEKGLSVSQVFLLSGIQRVIGLLIEIPTGALSDLKGHKYNLLFGTFSFSVSCLAFAFSTNFYGFFVAEVFMAFSAAFISGADTAFVYESLERNGEEENYEKVFGQMRAIQSVVNAPVILLSGFAAHIAWELPFYVGALMGFIAFLIATSFVEPATLVRGNGVRPGDKYWEYFNTIKGACKIAFKNVQLRWFLVYASILSVGLLVVDDFYQVYLKNHLMIPVVYSGVIFALLYIGQAIFSNYTSVILKKLGYERLFLLMPLLGIVTALLMGMFKAKFVIVFFALPYISTGMMATVASGYLNRRTSPGQRATVVSLRQMMRKLGYAVVDPFIGWSCDFWSFSTALLMAAGILVISLLLPTFYKQRYQLDFDNSTLEMQVSSAK